MDKLTALQKANPHIRIHSVGEDAFRAYGRVLSADTRALCTAAETAVPFPEAGSRYQATIPELEAEGAAPVSAITPKEPEDQVSMLDLTGQQIIAALAQITVETLTPIEAMNELYKLKRMLD